MVRKTVEFTKNKKVALVLSGGVTKAAAWHLGVSMALEDMGITFVSENTPKGSSEHEISTYVGSSAGALVCIYLAMGHTPHQIVNAFVSGRDSTLVPVKYKDMLSVKRPELSKEKMIDVNFFENFPFVMQKILSPIARFNGLFSTQGLSKYLEKHVVTNNDFKELQSDLFIVATQLDHSRKVIFGKYNYPNPRHDSTASYYTKTGIIDAASASMSVPPFYSPYPIKNTYNDQVEYYIDGEIRETLSTHVAIDNDCDIVISSWTHTPYHYQKEIGSLANYGLPAVCLQAIYLMIQKKIMAARERKYMARDTIDSVSQYMKNEGFSQKHRKAILKIIETKLDFRTDVQLVDIYPKHKNFELFFKNTFSLNPEVTSSIIKLGYHRAIEVLKKHELV